MMKRLVLLLVIVLSINIAGCASRSVSAEQNLSGIEKIITPTDTTTPVVDLGQHVLSTETSVAPPSPESTPTLESTPQVSPTAEIVAELPDEYYIWGIQGHKQYFSLGCEAGVAVDWAAFFDVQINEFEFQTRLPLSDNPDLGFVGSVDGPWGQVPPYAYGVHTAPIAALLQEYGVNAVGVKGYTLDQLKWQLANERPVIAWVIGNVVGGIPYEYTDSQGNTTIVAAYEHVIIVTGYSQEKIRYNNNGKYYDVPVDVFENSWSVLGNMVVVLADE